MINIAQEIKKYAEIVYLLQGGGALGAYQVGVMEALLENGCAPTWIIGTSIGGINGAIIAGNKPVDRIPRLKQFWETITVALPEMIPESLSQIWNDGMRAMQNKHSSDMAAMFGINGFFKPRLVNPWLESNQTPDNLSYYDTSLLRKTLEEVIDFKILNSKNIRLTVNAICIETGLITRFDNIMQELTLEHIMATAALPPGLPAIKIDNKYYWDAGLASNAPFAAILEESNIHNMLCFDINLFSQIEHVPNNIAGVLKRRKDLEFISQHDTLLNYFCMMQNYQRDIQTLLKLIPESNNDHRLAEIRKHQALVTLNIARFHYKDKPYDVWTKDYEFSQQSLLERIAAGYKDSSNACHDCAWAEFKPEEIQLHNF